MKDPKRFLKIMLVSGLIFGLFFGAGSGLTALILNMASGGNDAKADDGIMERQDGERTNILVLGIDARPGETNSRSDTMILVSVDPDLNKAAIVSIPRDTRVTLKGAQEKICAANILGGPEYAVSTVEDLMDINIDYWVEMDFNGFKKIVDTLGGVTINVPQRMYKPSEGIDLKPGTQELNGSQALAFVRFRDYVMGDIDRTTQQQAFLKALADEVLQPKTIAKLPKLIRELNQYVDTNMKVTDMLRLASWAPGFNSDSLVAQTLPGSFYDQVDANGILLQSYWEVDKKKVADLLNTMFDGETVAVVQDSVQSVQKPAGDTNAESAEKDGSLPDDSDDDRNWQRSQLPSPGHGVKVNNTSSGSAAGPEGYI